LTPVIMDPSLEAPDDTRTWSDSWPSSSDLSESLQEARSEYLPDSERDENRSMNQANSNNRLVQNSPLLAPNQLPVPTSPIVDAVPGFHSTPSWAPTPMQSFMVTPINLTVAPIATPRPTSAPNTDHDAARLNHGRYSHNPAAHPAGVQFFPGVLNFNPGSNFAFSHACPKPRLHRRHGQRRRCRRRG